MPPKYDATTHPGAMFRALRTEAGITLRDLSRLSGVTASHLSRYESGERELGDVARAHALAALVAAVEAKRRDVA